MPLNGGGVNDCVSSDYTTQQDDDFVIASILIVDPGRAIYSALGHTVLRLQCPTYNLDYAFSMEGEDLSLAKFFSGNLRQRAAAVPTHEYIQQYRDEDRTVSEYTLNLPIDVKKHLWEQMDRILELPDEPYDYINDGCAVSVFHWINSAVGASNINLGPRPDFMDKSRVRISTDNIEDNWSKTCLSFFATGEAQDVTVPDDWKIIVPKHLPEILGNATYHGTPLLDKTPHILYQGGFRVSNTWLSPMLVAIVLLIVAIANIWLRWRPVRWFFIVGATLLGLFAYYLVFVSVLPGTQWNWLVVPFSPLPLLFWHLRRYWALPYAAIIALWCIMISVMPNRLFLPPLIIASLAMAAVYTEVFLSSRKSKQQ